MEKIGSLTEIKRIEYEMLTWIKEVCVQNHLRYYLHSGTLLGAIRHKGFIPWDDDIDICMPRIDIEKLKEILIAGGKYQLIDIFSEGYFYNFYKLVHKETKLVETAVKEVSGLGIYIDIFPIEGMPTNIVHRYLHFWRLNRIRKRINCFGVKRPEFRKNVIKILSQAWKYYVIPRLYSLESKQRAYQKCAKKYMYDNSSIIFISGNRYGTKEIFDKSLFTGKRESVFEEEFFNIPKGAETVLTQLFNDYNTWPSVDKRITNHSFTAFYIDEVQDGESV